MLRRLCNFNLQKHSEMWKELIQNATARGAVFPAGKFSIWEKINILYCFGFLFFYKIVKILFWNFFTQYFLVLFFTPLYSDPDPNEVSDHYFVPLSPQFVWSSLEVLVLVNLNFSIFNSFLGRNTPLVDVLAVDRSPYGSSSSSSSKMPARNWSSC